MAEYKVQIITSQKKEQLFDELTDKIKFERKANIHGACVKLLTDNESFKKEWDDTFKFMNEDIRPHAKIFSIEDGRELQVLHDQISNASIIKNCDYYGWVKSIALAIISPPDTGKTTLIYGLLQDEDFNYISDDWFFLRLFENASVVLFIREDIADVWKEFSREVKKVKLDKMGRGIADVNILFGRIRESSTLKTVVLLDRNKKNVPFKKLSPYEALNYMINHDFCNPHQLIRDERKFSLRKNFFAELFSKLNACLLNTIETPQESLNK